MFLFPHVISCVVSANSAIFELDWDMGKACELQASKQLTNIRALL